MGNSSAMSARGQERPIHDGLDKSAYLPIASELLHCGNRRGDHNRTIAPAVLKDERGLTEIGGVGSMSVNGTVGPPPAPPSGQGRLRSKDHCRTDNLPRLSLIRPPLLPRLQIDLETTSRPCA